MNIISFSINKSVTVAMIFLAAVVFGFVSLSRLRIKLLPDISYPTLTVQTEYPDAAPLEVENFVTRPLEEAVGVVTGLRNIRSVSKPGLSEITLEFTWKTPMEYSALDVREKIDLVDLPKECNEPVILRYDPSLDPIIRIGIYGSENLVKLRNLAERVLKKDLESLEGVASAKVLGGLEEEIQVELDERKLALFRIPISLVSRRLSEDNVNQAGGKLRDRGSEFLLRTENEFKDVGEVRNTIIREEMGKKVVLADLGRVERMPKEREVITRLNGKEAVEIAIYKEGDANTVEVAKAVRKRVKDLADKLPDNIKARVLLDQAHFIERAIREVKLNAILGAILAVIVLFLFLHDLRSTVIIGLSIPISVMVTFFFMRQLGVSLNLMSLGGLALGIGMLVDNSIVVLESISRYKENGFGRKEATHQGASEVAKAVIASTLTTVAVFLPIVFVEGMAGQIFKDQALTVSISLLASLMVALMLIPMVSALRGGPETPTQASESTVDLSIPQSKNRVVRSLRRAGALFFVKLPTVLLKVMRRFSHLFRRAANYTMRPPIVLFDRIFKGIEKRYVLALNWTLVHRGRFISLSFLFFLLSLYMFHFLGKELIPQFSQGEFSFIARLPEGSPLDATDHKLKEMEKVVSAEPGVAAYFCTVGQTSRQGSNLKNKDKNVGQLNVIIKKNDRKFESALIKKLRDEFSRIEGITFKFTRPMYFTFQTPVQINVFGYNLSELRKVSENVKMEVGKIDGIRDVKASMVLGNPELKIVFDREKLASMGLQLEAVSNVLKTKIYGEVPTRLREIENDVDIRVRSSVWRAGDVDRLKSIVVGRNEDRQILLGSVAKIELGRGFTQISRISQQRAAVVSANIQGRDLGSVVADIRRATSGIAVPPGITVELAGQNEELLSSFHNLMFALILAVFLVYLVMASQFESFVHPLIILFTVPMGIVGVIWTLLLTGKPVSVVVLIGAIMLSGIVVNNGIVLIDYINSLRKRGMERESAIREAGRVRLRPILMTTMTTVLGLFPMALGLGEGAEIRTPMALAVIGGLLGATFLTLLLIPSVYSIMDRKNYGSDRMQI